MIILNETSGVPACAVCSSGCLRHHAGKIRKEAATINDLTKVTEFLSKNVIEIQINIRTVLNFLQATNKRDFYPFLCSKAARPVTDLHSLSDDLPVTRFVASFTPDDTLLFEFLQLSFGSTQTYLQTLADFNRCYCSVMFYQAQNGIIC